MRYLLDIRFKGTGYSGWQFQPNAHTVQEDVNKALSTLLRQEISTYGAGRTDAGVHAIQMPTHFDYDGELHPKFFRSLNGILPSTISVTQIYRPTLENFHARFSALTRAYRYQMIFKKDPHLYTRAWWCKDDLNFEAMEAGARIIPEFDSFESFCKANASNKTFFCDIMDCRFAWEGEILVFHIKANRFLRGMVRAIVGTLCDMGKGKLSEEGLRDVLRAKNRSMAGGAAPADGLYLSEVTYPEGSFEPIEFEFQ